MLFTLLSELPAKNLQLLPFMHIKHNMQGLLTLYVDELLGHLKVTWIEALIVSDVALSLRHRNHHVVPLFPIHLLC